MSKTGAKTATKIHRRDDVDPEEGLRRYGNVEFADPVNHKYPIDTEEHVRAAWSYIHHKDNAARYNKKELELIKDRIESAAGEFGIELHAE